jgi:hypothetical protein
MNPDPQTKIVPDLTDNGATAGAKAQERKPFHVKFTKSEGLTVADIKLKKYRKCTKIPT